MTGEATGNGYARFRSQGAIDGQPDTNGDVSEFTIRAGDDPDAFRIRVGSEEAPGNDMVMCGDGFDIGGRSIVIRTEQLRRFHSRVRSLPCV